MVCLKKKQTYFPMKKLIFFGILLLSISCSHHDAAPDNKPNLQPLTATERVVASANNDFAFTLFRQVQNGANNTNIFISPLSVTMALAMTMNGASESTRESILQVLDFGNASPEDVDEACKDLTATLTSMDRTVQLGLANSVWYNQRFAVRDSFATIIKNYFDGTTQGLNFSDPNSVKTINNWVASKTNNLIKNLIDRLTEDEVMLLINTIYFKGDWTYQFDASQTKNLPFYLEDGSSQNVSTMFSKGTKISLYQNQNLSLIDIPYGNQQFSMTVLMPTSNYSINQLVQTLNVDSLNSWLNKSDTLKPQLELPKFKMNWGNDLLNDLTNMGMLTTDFPYLFKDIPADDLAISKVIHQSYIDVNEKGTEAAAATAVGIELTSAGPSKPITIQINRSFIYLIREKHTNTILFIGQMFLPSYQ